MRSLTDWHSIRQGISQQAARHFLSLSASREMSGRSLIVLPVYNEEECLPLVIRELASVEDWLSAAEVDVCFVDDGSTDRSREILEREMPGRFTFHAINIGVSGVILTAASIAALGGYALVVQCDADGQHPLAAISGLLAHAKQNGLDLTIGSRFLRRGEGDPRAMRTTTPVRRIGARMISLWIRFLFRGVRVTDPTSGFRVYSAAALRHLMHAMPDKYPEPASIGVIIQSGLRIGEVAVDMRPRLAGHSNLDGWRNAVTYMVLAIKSLLLVRLRKNVR